MTPSSPSGHPMPAFKRVAVFCGSHHGRLSAYGDGARQLGQLLAKRGLGLVYGGGNVGLMGVIADAVLAGGGEAIGVIPKALEDLEVAHRGLTQLHITDTMHERKRLIYDMADAVIAMPGGIGTMDELFESLTWNSLGYMPEPCGVLDIEGYYQPLIAMLDQMVENGFVHRDARSNLHVSSDPSELLDGLARARQNGGANHVVKSRPAD